jgi:hypothetical protein
MIFPPRPKGFERDDTEHGKLYYTSDQLKKYGIQCVEEYKRCQKKPESPRSEVVDDLMSMMGMKK